MLKKFVNNFQMIRNLKKKIDDLLRNVNFARFRMREANVQHMENFAITVKSCFW